MSVTGRETSPTRPTGWVRGMGGRRATGPPLFGLPLPPPSLPVPERGVDPDTTTIGTATTGTALRGSHVLPCIGPPRKLPLSKQTSVPTGDHDGGSTTRGRGHATPTRCTVGGWIRPEDGREGVRVPGRFGGGGSFGDGRLGVPATGSPLDGPGPRP